MIRPLAADGKPETGGIFQPVPRPRVVERIAAATEYRVAMLIAPAGYGKSVALTQYLGTLAQPCVAFNLDAQCGTLLGFVRGFADALQSVAPAARQTLSNAQAKSRKSTSAGADLAVWMHAHIKMFTGLIAIDDLHIGEHDPEISKFVAALVALTRGRARWIIASRHTLDLPIATWLAYQEMGLAVDEFDLRFTTSEAKAAAQLFKVGVREGELNQILQMTAGWPTALSFALHTSTRSVDLRNIESMTREMVYRYLAEQVFASLDEEQRAFLLFTCLMPQVNVRMLSESGFDRAAAIIEQLRHRAAFIYADAPGIYRYHDLFKSFLRHELELRGSTEMKAGITKCARLFQDQGDNLSALKLYVEAGDSAQTLAILEKHGYELIEHGHADSVEVALERLDPNISKASPLALSLRARFQELAGRFSEAEELYRRAIFAGSREQQVVPAIRLVHLLNNLGRPEPKLLDGYAFSGKLDILDSCDVLGTQACAYAAAGKTSDAQRVIAQALDQLQAIDDDELRAKTYNRAGLVYFYSGDSAATKKYATEGTRLAIHRANFALALNGYSVLSAAYNGFDDDIPSALGHLRRLAECAVKSGDIDAQRYALVAALDIEARRGNLEQLALIEQQLDTLGNATLGWMQLLPATLGAARALRDSWSGNFTQAANLLAPLLPRIEESSERALRMAEYAVYLSARHKDEDAVGALAALNRGLKTTSPDSPVTRWNIDVARLLSAAANALIGQRASARRMLRSPRFSESESVGALARAVKGFCDALDGVQPSERFFESVRSLEPAHLGGYGRLLERSYLAAPAERSPLLTRAELQVLQALSDGESPKEIASGSGRSVFTVQAHIRSVIGKLGVSGRNEATATARRKGLVR